MIDTHNHILPGVDDGAEFFEEAKEMIEMGMQNGTTAFVLTPHFIRHRDGSGFATEELYDRFALFSSKIRDLFPTVKLFFGAENFVSDRFFHQIQERDFIPLNQTRYVLIEFDFYEQAFFAEHMVTELVKAGYRPILAHPERYHFLHRDPSLFAVLRERGCLFQMNAGSPFGVYGPQAEELSYWMLRKQMADCVGSDAHSPYHRTPDMSKLAALLSMQFSQKYEKRLMEINPERILAGQDWVQQEEDKVL